MKKLLPFFFAFFATLLIAQIFLMQKNDVIIGRVAPNSDVIGMPLVEDTDPNTQGLWWGAPQEDRGPEFRRFLAPSLKISVSGSSGSGTIVYYDPQTQEAYVASCGHLWSGNRTAAEVLRSPVNCKVITWYHNDTKLPQPKEYPAQVLFWSNTRGYDSSLIKFKPDWIPSYFPIAPLDYDIPTGKHYHSVGCDGGREVAHYDVEIVGYRGDDLITTRNSPRPGRSGGGLMSDDGYYIATCWGTSDTSGGGGIGYFTPLKSIHQVYSGNGYDWLLKVSSSLARKIPIYDRNNPQGNYPKDYVPLPGPESFYIPRY
jgi:hypothetical protein